MEIEYLFALQEAMCNYIKTQVSFYDPTKKTVHFILRQEDDIRSNCGQNFEKIVSFDDIMHLIDKQHIVTSVDFDCGINFYPETPTEIKQINRERIYVSRSSEKPKCIPGNDQLNCSFDKQHSSDIFLNSCNLWDMVLTALMSTNHSNHRYPMSNQYPSNNTSPT